MNKRALEGLISCGAFDSIGLNVHSFWLFTKKSMTVRQEPKGIMLQVKCRFLIQ